MKTYRTVVATALSALLLATPQIGMAFKLPSDLFGNESNTSKANYDPVLVKLDQLVTTYVAADRDVLKAQARLADAIGLKKRAAQLNAVNEALGEGATTQESLEVTDAVLSEAAAEIQARLQETNLKLNAESRKKYVDALGALGRGVTRYSQLKEPMRAFQASLSSTTWLGALQLTQKISVGKFILTTAPDKVTNLSRSLEGAITFAKNHSIPVPADATAAL